MSRSLATRALAPTYRACMALACIALLAACARGSDDASTDAPAAPQGLAVSLAPVVEREVERAVVVSGPVAPVEEMQLGVEASGLRVTRLHVDVGQAVARGQLLLELDARTLMSELAQADAAAREAEAGAVLAQQNLARAEALARDRLIAAANVDELRAARVQAQARAATARAMRDAARLRRDFATLRAPAAGVISKRLVQAGQVVAAGTPLLHLIRDGRLEWRADLSDAELARVDVGDPVSIQATGVRVDGRVRAVSPGVDASTRTGTVYADLPDPGPLRAGSFVEGRISTGSARAPTVPTAAVVQRDGASHVFTVEGSTARRVRVVTGSTSGDRVEVIQGVRAGQQVVARGAGFLADGDTVRVVPAEPDTARAASAQGTTPASAR